MARSRAQALKLYKHELERTKRYREEQGYDQLWERMIDLYRGHPYSVATTEDQITVNIAFSTINVIGPTISVNYPKITVMPTHPLYEEAAFITEAIVNYEWKHNNYQDQFRLAVKDYLVVGHGWIKTGYRYKQQEVSLSDNEMNEALGEAQAEADAYAAENPDMAGVVPTDDELMENLPQTKLVTVEDQPYVERISPFDIFVDPEATTLDDAKWICQKIIRPLTEVRKDPKYKPGARANVQADMDVSGDRNDRNRSFFRRGNEDPADQRVTVYEWYDLKANTVATCAEGSDEFLIDPQPCPFAFGHPFIMLRNYDIPDYFYPMGELEAIEPLILELNKTRSIEMQVRKKFARKFMFRAGEFDAAGRQALESDVDNQYVPVASDTPFDQLIGVVPQTQVPPDLYQHSETVEDDIGTVSGISDYQRGQTPETRRTATEAAIISDSVNARSADKLSQIEKGIARVARRIVQLNQQFMSADKVAPIVGQDQAIYWLPYGYEEIKGEFDFEVEAGSTQPMNETTRRQQATAMLEGMMPFVQMGVVDPAKLAQHVLKFGFNVPNPGKFMTPMAMMMAQGGDPMQQMMMQQMGMGGAPAPPGGGGTGGPQGPPDGAGGFTDDSGEVGNQLPQGAMGGMA